MQIVSFAWNIKTFFLEKKYEKISSICRLLNLPKELLKLINLQLQ